MYTFESPVRYSETGEDGKMTLGAIVNYLQDCTYFHSESLGVGEKYLLESGYIWVLSSWQIVMDGYPSVCDRISVGTQAYDYDSFFAYRNFVITDAANPEKYYVRANSAWVLVDISTGKPKRLEEKDISAYGFSEPLPMDYARGKIQYEGEGSRQAPLEIAPYHLDSNHHVNNQQYIQIAQSVLPGEIHVRELRVEYKRQAKLGDMVYPVVYPVEGGYVVALNMENGRSFAVVSFQLY